MLCMLTDNRLHRRLAPSGKTPGVDGMVGIALVVVVGLVFVLGLLLGQVYSHREVQRRERQLAAIRRERNDLARALRDRPRWR